PAGAGFPAPAPSRRRSPTPDGGAGGSHLAVGRTTPDGSRLALRSLVPGEAPCPPAQDAYCPGSQPRAPATGAQKRGFCLRRVRRKLVSTDPRRHAILRRLRFCWRHRPRGSVLLFFDVQPITVQASGGRRYTTAPQLVLHARQKTRGRFYLFLGYEVNRGVVRWAFYPGKGAAYVCRFLRRVRGWYPRRAVRIALDRD